MKNFFIIDVYNLIYRMFYAIPEMHTPDGKQINAVFGVAKFLRSLWENGETHHLVITTDGPGENVRHQLFAEYKGTRDRMPDNLRSQIPEVFKLFEVLRIPVLEKEGYEADDLIGSMVHHIKHQDKNGVDWSNLQAVIISSDKDLCQFVEDGKVHIFDAMKQKFLRRADVIEKFSVPPEQVVDYLAIVGDTSDNIPGIMGFGPKKAEDLLGRFGSLAGIYDHLDDISEKLRNTLIEQRENAFLSYQLASIHTDLPIDFDLASSEFSNTNFWNDELIALFQTFGFKSLLPTQYQAVVKKYETREAREVDSLEKMNDFMKEMAKQKELILTTDQSHIYVSFNTINYHIEPVKVDIASFIYFLETSGILVVGYDVKEDLKRIFRYKNPLQTEVEGQGRLF